LPLLSIIIPVLEPDAELDRCMQCIQGAFIGAPVPEVVVVTPRRFVAQTQFLFPWARVCAETRKGIYAAMNDGAHFSRGEYVYFLGKDDIVLPTLCKAVALLERERPFALFCDVYWGSRGVYRGAPSRIRLLARNLCHQGIVYSREAFDLHGPYLRRMRVQADHLLNIKILWDRKSGSRVRYLEEPLAWYSGDGFSMAHRDPVFWRLYPTVMRRFVGSWAACLLTLYRRLRDV
jgi:glycosyltransferase involved in cell wall biosynthesis